jgi:sugar phosphate isomerase/epimerase
MAKRSRRMRFSVFTVIMQEFDRAQVVKHLAQLGYDGVEWRVHESGPHIQLAKLAAEAAEVRKLTENAGLELVSLATYLSPGDLDSIKRVAEGAKKMGVPMFRVMPPWFDGSTHYRELCRKTVAELKKVEAVCLDMGLKVLLEIHMRNIIPSASAAYRIVEGLDPKAVGIIFDPGNMIYEGMERWLLGMQLLGPYLAHVHVKNSKWEISKGEPDGNLLWRPTWATLRGGMVNWGEVIADLKQVGYQGYLSSEDFATELPTLEKLTDDLAFLASSR